MAAAAVGAVGVGDEELAARATQGDRAAFALLYQRWSIRVRRFALARLHDPDEADDVVQDVFVALLRCLPAYQGRSRFGTWLLGIAHHVICRSLRRERRRMRVPLAEIAELPAPLGAAGERRLDAVRALRSFGDTLAREASRAQLESFQLAYLENRPIAEVSTLLQRRPETVRAQLSRARRTLLDSTPGLADLLDVE
jgi:RNA polymerase sigma-70 factor (ECF subfamily)